MIGDPLLSMLRRANKKVAAIYRHLDKSGLTAPQFAVLAELQRLGKLSQTSLVEAASIDRSTLGTMMTVMERDDLISRKRSSEDERTSVVEITTHGRRQYTRALKALDETEKHMIRAVGGGIGKFTEALEALAEMEVE